MPARTWHARSAPDRLRRAGASTVAHSNGSSPNSVSPPGGCRAELRRIFEAAIQAAYPSVSVAAAVEPCAQAQHGDYQCNNAMALFGQLKKAGGQGVPKSPRAVAEAIVAQLADSTLIEKTSCAPGCVACTALFTKTSWQLGFQCVNSRITIVCMLAVPHLNFLAFSCVKLATSDLPVQLPLPHAREGMCRLAGPGFINITLKTNWLAAHVKHMLASGPACAAPKLSQRVIVDLSSPNVAKEMHVGHLRSTIIGDTLANVLELCGADVLRLNHIGDWGTQFGMLIQYMKEEREGGLGADGKDEAVSDLMALYKCALVILYDDMSRPGTCWSGAHATYMHCDSRTKGACVRPHPMAQCTALS